MPRARPHHPIAVGAGCVALVAVSSTVFAARVQAVDVFGKPSWWPLLRPAALLTTGTLIAGLLVLGVLRLLHRPTPGLPAILAGGIVAAATAVLVTTPVAVAYDDGCNSHADVAPAVAVPYLKAVRPADTSVSYASASTEVLCSKRPIRRPSSGG